MDIRPFRAAHLTSGLRHRAPSIAGYALATAGIIRGESDYRSGSADRRFVRSAVSPLLGQDLELSESRARIEAALDVLSSRASGYRAHRPLHRKKKKKKKKKDEKKKEVNAAERDTKLLRSPK